jgi:polyhydroxybutyrate depolymerase
LKPVVDHQLKPRRARLPRWRRGKLRFLPPQYFDRQSLEVEGTVRTYWTPPDPSVESVAAALSDPPPLLIALHGLNSSGSRLAWWSGLGDRGPLAGFRCVFPDALRTVWDDHGCGRVDGVDDLAFIVELIEYFAQTGQADPRHVVLTGVSSGATFAERLLRAGAVNANAIALVTGTARVASREHTPPAAANTDVLLIAGTGDPMLPYEGGAARGPLARATMKDVGEVLLDASDHDSVAPEQLMADWVAANGCQTTPLVEPLAPTAEHFPVVRLAWAPQTPGGASVELYRIDGGGHGWPNARQYLPARMIGRIPQGFDATGIVLRFACGALERTRAATLAPEAEAGPSRSAG